MRNQIVAVLLALSLLGCAPSSDLLQVTMSAEFFDMQEESFSLQVIAPLDVIREYAICKAVWFAETKNASQIALSDPVYGNDMRGPVGLERTIPPDWGILDTTAYLSDPKGTPNPFITIAEMSTSCRDGWEWYR